MEKNKYGEKNQNNQAITPPYSIIYERWYDDICQAHSKHYRELFFNHKEVARFLVFTPKIRLTVLFSDSLNST